MKFLKYLLFLVLIVIIALAVYVAVQPSEYDFNRTKTIKAPVSVVYNQVIDYKTWPTWGSWFEKEPDMEVTYGEQTEGVGASYTWVGKDGPGSMKTTEATPNESIMQELQFGDYEPSTVYWNFEPVEEGTKVTWGMKSDKMPFMFKAYAAFAGGMEGMVAPDYERGLERLDSVTVASMKAYSIEENGITQHGGGFYLYNTTSCRIDEIESKMQEMMPKVGMFAEKNNVKMAGAPFTLYHSWDEENGTTMFSCCVPTTDKVVTTDSNILTGQLEPFKAVKITLKGNYENLKEAWEKAFEYIAKNNLEAAEEGPMIEAYLTDPMSVPNPANWITEIYIAVN